MDGRGIFSGVKKKTLNEVIQEVEKEQGIKLDSVEWVDLIFKGINDLDSSSLNYIKGCRKLSLSSNLITRLPDFHFENLKILSLGRNKIR
jgi:Leucine-rich repeat (LRR) protein